MAAFSSATLDRIRGASDIVDIIGAVLPLRRAGGNFLALCPFHKEKTPSFNVSPQKQIFHCFGCHKGGDVFRFVQEYENVTFPEAVKRLADRAKIPLEVENGPDAGARFLKDTLLGIHDRLANRWHELLLQDPRAEIARSYLAKRRVTADAVKLFRLGYAPDAWDDTVNWGRSLSLDLTLLEKAGLVVPRDGGGYYDRFRGRLMFPIFDEQGRVIAFSGRVLGADEKTAKYVNSPETPIFTKGRVFYGLDKSKRALLDRGFAVVCEGQLDLIASFMAGVQNIVAPQGTAFTPDHARILKRYVNEVVLCFDSDTAGQSAAVRVLDSLLGAGLAIRVAALPAPHDPDSYIKAEGPQRFCQLIEAAAGFFDYYLQRLCASNDLNSDRGRVMVLRSMSEALFKTGNLVLIDTYAQKTALALGVAAEAVRAEFRKHARKELPPAAADDPARTARAAPPGKNELWLLKISLTHSELIEWVAGHLDLNWIMHAVLRDVLALCFRMHGAGRDVSPAALLAEIEEAEVQSLITETLADGRPIPNPQQQLEDIVLRLRNQMLDRKLMELQRSLTYPALSDDAKLDLLRDQTRLRGLKKAALAPLGE